MPPTSVESKPEIPSPANSLSKQQQPSNTLLAQPAHHKSTFIGESQVQTNNTASNGVDNLEISTARAGASANPSSNDLDSASLHHSKTVNPVPHTGSTLKMPNNVTKSSVDTEPFNSSVNRDSISNNSDHQPANTHSSDMPPAPIINVDGLDMHTEENGLSSVSKITIDQQGQIHNSDLTDKK